jgi:hypothetical protein
VKQQHHRAGSFVPTRNIEAAKYRNEMKEALAFTRASP